MTGDVFQTKTRAVYGTASIHQTNTQIAAISREMVNIQAPILTQGARLATTERFMLTQTTATPIPSMTPRPSATQAFRSNARTPTASPGPTAGIEHRGVVNYVPFANGTSVIFYL